MSRGNRTKRSSATPRSKFGKLNIKMKRKLAGLFIAVVLAFVALAIRITVIAAGSGEQYAKAVLSQTQSQNAANTTIPFKRGDILDSNGNVLATSRKVYNVILDCYVCNSDESYYEPTVSIVSEQLGIEENVLRGLLTAPETKASKYRILKTGVSIEEKQAFENYLAERDSISDTEIARRKNVKGIWFEENYQRVYPLGSVACDVIGFANAGDTADWGIEGYYSNTLNGTNGRKYNFMNEDADVEQTIIDATDGKSVVLTLDVNVQQIAEKYIENFMQEMVGGPYGDRGAANVGVLIMRPKDGAILAMASTDPYDLNSPRDLTPFYSYAEISTMNDEQMLENLNKIWRNYCISDTYEPGSTYKPIVMASALEDGTIGGYEEYLCDGREVVAGTTIKCSNVDGHGEETLADVIRNSCNDGMMQIVSGMGIEEFAKYQQIFNFGSRTGIDLSGEASGILHTTNTMGEVDLATGSFGQGFTCTMIQEAAAMCSVINGGAYYRPHLLERVVDSEGHTVRTEESVLMRRTISTEVSEMIKGYMKESVDNGTSRYSKIDGYSSGGKTGTSQKIPRGNGKYTVSFIGFWPADDPEVLCYVVVDEPNAQDQANSAYAQVIARQIMTEALPYLNIFPDEAATGREVLDIQGARALTNETQPDTNVPSPEGGETVPEGGNNEETDGYTNEEADLNG